MVQYCRAHSWLVNTRKLLIQKRCFINQVQVSRSLITKLNRWQKNETVLSRRIWLAGGLTWWCVYCYSEFNHKNATSTNYLTYLRNKTAWIDVYVYIGNILTYDRDKGGSSGKVVSQFLDVFVWFWGIRQQVNAPYVSRKTMASGGEYDYKNLQLFRVKCKFCVILGYFPHLE